jgi:hypothetical protein
MNPRRLIAALGCFSLLLLIALLLSCGGKKSTAPVVPTDPRCSVSSTSLAFGTVPVGSSATRSIEITNSGGGTLTGSVSVSCSDFTLVGSGSYSLTAGQSASFTVRYTPTGGGSANCTVTTGCVNVVCAATGQLPACEVTVDTLRFYRRSPLERMGFEIHNNGATTLSGTVHTSCPDFALFGDSTYALAPGAAQFFQVSFAPTQPGVRSCALSTGLSGCREVVCTGIGPNLVASPTLLDLGTSWHRIDKTFTLTNNDSFPLSGTVAQHCTPFSIIGPRDYNLSPGQSASFTAAYSPPNVAGLQDCSFDLGIASAGGVSCSGQSVVLDPVLGACAGPTTTLLDFGTLTVGQSASLPLTIRCSGLPDPSVPLCYGVLVENSSDLTLNGALFEGMSPGDTRPGSVTVTPSQVGVHHIFIQVWARDDYTAYKVSNYVECRVTAVP